MVAWDGCHAGNNQGLQQTIGSGFVMSASKNRLSVLLAFSVIAVLFFIISRLIWTPASESNEDAVRTTSELRDGPAGTDELNPESSLSGSVSVVTNASPATTSSAKPTREKENSVSVNTEPVPMDGHLPKSSSVGLLNDPAVLEASKEFKQRPGFRHGPAKTLIPHLKNGMSKNSVKTLLGDPDHVAEDGSLWKYTLFYSLFIDIRFDKEDRVLDVDSCVLTNMNVESDGQ